MTEEEWLNAADPKLMVEYLKGPPTVEIRELYGRSLSFTMHYASFISERKARLFGVACCQFLSELFDNSRCQQLIDYGLQLDLFARRSLVVPTADCCLKAVSLAERIAEGTIHTDELRPMLEALFALGEAGGDYAASHDSTDDYEHLLVATGNVASAIAEACSGYPIEPNVFGLNTGGALERLAAVVSRTARAAAFHKGLGFVQSASEGDSENLVMNSTLLRDIVGNPFRPVTLDPRWQTETVVALATSIYADRAFDRMPILADALEEAGCHNAEVLNHCRGDGPHVRGCWVVDLVLGKQ